MSSLHLHRGRSPRVVGRRAFLADLGRGSLGIAIVGLTAVACSGDDDEGDAGSDAGGGETGGGVTSSPIATATATTATGGGGGTAVPTATASQEASAVTSGEAGSAGRWERVSFGFVSAYILVRGGEAAVVDTGTADGGASIEGALAAAGVGWTDVGSVILTHSHGDHIGGLGDVLASAGDAAVFAGAGDIPAIPASRPVTAVGDGEQVFDLEIIETPGHTPGHISVLDGMAGVLIAGDAMNGSAGGVTGPNPSFTPDMTTANLSVVKLAERSFETVYFGHGEPVLTGASGLVTDLAESL
jgi:glyoxylase-like metal-dependent hydrolase (beta-lactamase superfamily II)